MKLIVIYYQKLMDNIFKYSYCQFVNDSKNLCSKSKGIFKLCSSSILNIVYIKANFQLLNDSYSLELNILFSETYKLPVLYFIIYDNKTYTPINYESFKTENNIDTKMINLCEISKENHPLNGNVYEFMHLCKLNQFINKVDDVDNILIFWSSIVLQLFNLDLSKIICMK